jgi:hypothetical protein
MVENCLRQRLHSWDSAVRSQMKSADVMNGSGIMRVRANFVADL